MFMSELWVAVVLVHDEGRRLCDKQGTANLVREALVDGDEVPPARGEQFAELRDGALLRVEGAEHLCRMH